MTTVDLHTHSTASDGTDSPEDLVRLVAEAGLESFALTDHDTTRGLERAFQAAKKHNVKFIPGCEIAVEHADEEVHLLAYWIPQNSVSFENLLGELRAFRHQRNQKIFEKLESIGCSLDIEEVRAKAAGSVGRPHIAMTMVEKGFAPTVAEAFLKYLGKDGQAFVPRKLFPLEEGVARLAAEGATVVLAHPCLSLQENYAGWVSLLKRLSNIGLSGIEGYHNSHDEAAVRLCVDLAKECNLVLTGGSDYHGLVKPDVRLGRGSLNMRLQSYLLDNLITKRLSMGLSME